MTNSGDNGTIPMPHYLPQLPSEEEERLDKLFKQLDINGDGRIDIYDLTEAFEKLGLSHYHYHAEVNICNVYCSIV